MPIEHYNPWSVRDSEKIKSDHYLEEKAVSDVGLWFCVLCCRYRGSVQVKPSTAYCGTEFYFSATVRRTLGAPQMGIPKCLAGVWISVAEPETTQSTAWAVMLMDFTEAVHYLNL